MARLLCVGVGIELGAHLTPAAKKAIASSDVVLYAASDSLFEAWMAELHPQAHSLQSFYAPGKSRKTSYQEMTQFILQTLEQNTTVAAVFYGHPGVFVQPARLAMAAAIKQGHEAIMLPGISAEDCLYADLNIDPGRYGCQMYEASQFLFYQRNFDTAAYLILWQIALVGDQSHTRFQENKENVQLFVEYLQQHYPTEHEVIVYEARASYLDDLRKVTIPLAQLATVELTEKSTLVIPPATKMQRNKFFEQQQKNINNLTLIHSR
ncbi:MAG: hypothetical protein HWE13_02970 [Gammaproteobacteria bacterium]|nr:hypothetical protein [Gammaproteobacteria bacterium]NVK87058.1 hypothetical protein [Gammaproteobacteria bacterium]